MAKVITSPVKHFSGTVTLAEPLNLEQVLAYEEAQAAAAVVSDAGLKGAKEWTRLLQAWEPAFTACVEGASIPAAPNFPARLPATPKIPSIQFCAWLVRELTALYDGEQEANDPNE